MRVSIASLVVVFLLFFTSVPLISQDIGEESRPSVSIFNLILDESNQIRIGDHRFSGSSLEDRAFVDLIADLELNLPADNIKSGSNYNMTYLRDQLSQYMLTNKLPQQIVRHQFMIGDDFVWSNDLLRERAQYSQTLREAAVDLSTERGAIASGRDQALMGLTRTYVLFNISKVTEREIQSPFDAEKTIKTVTSTPSVILFKLDYNDREEIVAALGSVYCSSDEDCTDKETRFNEMDLKIKHVSTTSNATTASSGGSTVASLNTPGTLNDLFLKSFELGVKNVRELQLRVYVESTSPLTSKIGTKEGVRVFKRYKVVRQDLLADDTIRERHRGYVRGFRVTDNRSAAVRVNPETGREELVVFKPTEFKQVHGMKIEPFDVLKESVDYGITTEAFGAFGAYSSFGLAVLANIPGTFGVLGGLLVDISSDEYNWGVADATTILYQGGLVFGKELFVANGNMRVYPQLAVLYNYGELTSTDSDVDTDMKNNIQNIGGKLKLGVSLQLRENIGITGSLAYTFLSEEATMFINDTEFEVTEYSALFSNQGGQFGLGIRFSF